MTRDEWDRCTEPQKMLLALRASGRATERRLRLFVVACCWGVRHLLPDEETQEALGVAERLADGQVTEERRRATSDIIEKLYREVAPSPAYVAVHLACGTLSFTDVMKAAGAVASLAVQEAAVGTAEDWNGGPRVVRRSTGESQAALLRCIFGPVLFRPLPPVAPAVLAWGGGMVGRLAAGVCTRNATSRRGGWACWLMRRRRRA
jgi:hypothetical protein